MLRLSRLLPGPRGVRPHRLDCTWSHWASLGLTVSSAPPEYASSFTIPTQWPCTIDPIWHRHRYFNMYRPGPHSGTEFHSHFVSHCADIGLVLVSHRSHLVSLGLLTLDAKTETSAGSVVPHPRIDLLLTSFSMILNTRRAHPAQKRGT